MNRPSLNNLVPAIRNGLWNAGANLAGALSGAIGSILIVRGLSAEAYGEFSYYIWLAGLVSTVGTWAAPLALTKITSELRGRHEHTEARALIRGVLLALLSINVLLSGGVIIWASSASALQRIYLLLVAAYLLPNALSAAFRSALWGREHYREVSITEIFATLLQLALIGAASMASWGAPGFVAAVLSASIIRATGMAWTLRPVGASAVAARLPSRATLRRYLAFFVPATLSLVFTIIIWERSEVFFLAQFSGLSQIGFYNLAYTSYAMFLTLGWALVNGFHPAISRDYGAGDWQRIREQARQGMILAGLYAVPLCFGSWAALEGLFKLLYGDKMAPVVPVAQVLFVGLLPGVVAAVLGFTINAVGNAWLAVRFGIGMAVLNIGLDLVLIPRLGALGGAIANSGAQLVYSLFLVVAARRLYQIEPPWRTLGSIMVVGLVTTFLLPKLVQLWLPGIAGLAGAIAVSGCAYTLAVWFLGHLQPLRAATAYEAPVPAAGL